MAASKTRKLTKQQLLDAERENKKFARRRLLAGFFVLSFVCVIAWQADRWLDVHVKKIQIEGDLTASERGAVMNTIADAIENSGAAGLHSLSLDQVQTALAELSWADRVSARRRWPDTLVIRLMRHTVVARWGGGGYVASNGQVITPAGAEADAPANLPLLHCTDSGSARAMEVFNLLNRTLNPKGLDLVELRESELGEWTAGVASDATDGVVQVTLGRDDLAARLQRFLAVRSHILKRSLSDAEDSEPVRMIAAVDARYHNGVAVSWVEEGAL